MEEMKWLSSARLLGELAANDLSLAWLWLKPAKHIARDSATGTWHVQNQPHTEPSQNCNITYWTHRIEEMKWFSSAMLCELAANDLGFGLALAWPCTSGSDKCSSCKLFETFFDQFIFWA
jgi:hypothetical protein